MILEHYSNEPLVWPPRDYQQFDLEGGMSMFKPNGLWVSVQGEDDWPTWCQAEEFRLDHYQVCTRVILKPEANLKIITNESEIIAFDNEYDRDYVVSPTYSRHSIDWTRLAGDFDGIIIAPYIWSCRLPMYGGRDAARSRVSEWYYPWDCASGCIWNGTKAIAAFEVTEGQTAVAAE